MLCNDGKISLFNFVGTVSTFCLTFLPSISLNVLNKLYGGLVWGPALYFVLANVVVKCIYKGYPYQVAIRAMILGYIFSLGIFIKLYAPPNIQIFGVYMCVMSIFHYTEFLAIAIIQPSLVSTDSYVINHSPQYTIAAISSWIEFFIETYFFPSMKTAYWLSNFGLFICICGEALRKSAMLTAKSNFNHLVQCEKSDDHILITHGVYSAFRHPSYVGWFYWSIGTQLTLLNPICMLAYTLISWLFFKERITIEEISLLNFFGQQYCDYQQKVGTGLPFIQGYKIKP